jgi:outer membrane protein assembly factor BamB
LWWVEGISRIVDCTPCYANGLVYLATWTPGGDDENRIRMEPFAEALMKYDQNSDQLLGEEELPEGEVRTRFYRMDINQDGYLDRREWEKYAQVFERAKNVALAVDPRGQGDLSNTGIVWQYRRSLPTVPSSVVYQDVFYMVKDGGIITSLDALTGEPLKQGRAAGPGNYYASLVAGDGKVYLCSERGVVTVLRVGRPWEILSSHDFGERIMATPTIRDGHIYLRTEKALYCFRKRTASR